MSNKRALDVIQVNSPCPALWEQMAGDEQRRFCTHCRKFVHNLTQMPSDQAERLVCESAGELCVRFARDESTGKIITLDYRPAPKTSRRRALLIIASILGALGFTGTWAAHKLLRQPPPVQGQFVAGGIGPPPPVLPGK
jgi:hypothetical protein